MITRSRKRQKRAEGEGFSNNDKRINTAMYAKNAEQKRFWLDEMPVDIREQIARFFTGWGEWNDDGLNLARTSELQRRAVLAASSPRIQFLLPNVSRLPDAWAELLADHVRDLTISFLGDKKLRYNAHKHSPCVRMLRGTRLEKVTIPGMRAFLDALRDAEDLRDLCVHMRICSRRSLLNTLRRRGASLSSLALECGERNVASCNPSSNKCPMSFCLGSGPDFLTSLCPNLKELVLKCPHIPPYLTAFLVDKLPLLESIGVCSPFEIIDLSTDDIAALRGLARVRLGNISGGVRVATRLGKPVISLTYNHPDDLGAAYELLNCPQLCEIDVEMTIEEMRSFTETAQRLPNLRSAILRLLSDLSFKDVEDVARDAVKILRICNEPNAHIFLECRVPQYEGDFKEELGKIKSKMAKEGTKIVFLRDWKDPFACGIYIRGSAR